MGKEKLGVAGSVGVVLFFMIFSGFLYANLYFLELIGKNTTLETEENENANSGALNGYAWAGGAGWVLLGWALALLYYHLTDREIGETLWAGMMFYYALAMYLILVISCNLHPYTQFREFKKAKSGLGAPEIHISCWANGTKGDIKIPPANNYITLVDAEWQPSLNKSVIKSTASHGWDYVLSPIEYKGPLKNCKFEPSIFAACFAKGTGGQEATVCGWGRTSMVTIRKLDSSPFLEGYLKSKLPVGSVSDLPGTKYGKENRDRIFEWNSNSQIQVKEFIASVDSNRDDVQKRITIGWFITTGVVTILCIAVPDVMFAIASGLFACCLWII